MRNEGTNAVPAKLLRVPEAAERLTISVRAVWAMISAGRLKAIRLGPRVTRIDSAEVEAMIAAALQRGGR